MLRAYISCLFLLFLLFLASQYSLLVVFLSNLAKKVNVELCLSLPQFSASVAIRPFSCLYILCDPHTHPASKDRRVLPSLFVELTFQRVWDMDWP